MKTIQLKTKVASDGSVHLTNLPPDKEVEVTIAEPFDWPKEFKQWQKDFQTRDPFKGMTKEQVLEKLRESREKIYYERHGN